MEEIKKCFTCMKGTNAAERLATSCRIMLFCVLMCGNDTDSASFLIWAVMKVLFS